MNIVQLKQKYGKVFKIKLEGISITYRPFNAKEMIFLMTGDNEDKYKDQVTREAIINKDEVGELTWQSIEQLYTQILKISSFGSEEDILNKKTEIKKSLDENPYLVLIKQIIRCIPTIDINTLLECNSDQLLFYTILSEDIRGVQLINQNQTTSAPATIAPTLSTQKKATMTTEQLVEVGMQASTDDLTRALNSHNVKVKQFVPKKKSPLDGE